MALHLPPTPEREMLEKSYGTLQSRYKSLLDFNYAGRYEALLRTEGEYAQYLVDPGMNEYQDLSIQMVPFDYPENPALTGLNRALLNISLRRDIISKESVRAIQNLSNWQSLCNDVEAFYQKYHDYLLTFPEIKTLKTIGEKTAEINQHIPHVLGLKDDVNRYYHKDGNIVYGEAYSYRMAVREVLEDLDAKMETTSRQFAIFSKMKEAGM